LPKNVAKALDKTRNFSVKEAIQKENTTRKYHLAKWTKICKSKNKDGLGLKDIRKMNLSLLCKWWWKLEKTKRFMSRCCEVFAVKRYCEV
jgi:hypothetical protein